MNNFPAMTEEQRQELAEVARHEIKVWDDGGHYKELLKIALAALAAPPAPVLRVPDGWKLVPIEPTEDMLAAAKEWFGLTTTAEGVYEKMLDAAPEARNEKLRAD